MSKSNLENPPVPTSVKLSLLWASLMFLYIYNDYFSLYVPGILENMAEGKMGPQGVVISDGGLVGMSLMLAVPALMIFLSVALAPRISRWANIVLGTLYSIVQALTLLVFSEAFFRTVVGIEIVLTVLIVGYSWRWPRTPAAS